MASTAIVCPKNNVLGAVLALPDQDLQVMTDFIGYISVICLNVVYGGVLLCNSKDTLANEWVHFDPSSLSFTYQLVIARLELANPSCAANVACLHACNNRPDETECQIKCRDLFENSLVDEFKRVCSLMKESHERSVYLRSLMFGDSVPNPAFLVKNFNVADFVGKWFVISGLFTRSEYRGLCKIQCILQCSTIMTMSSFTIKMTDIFCQSKIENKQDDYIFVNYRGRNDAWDVYGGAVVYTRSAVLPESVVLELEMAAKSIRRDFNKFISTDNKGS
ncbi:hypothetical protein POTOM_061969 [Populus tomentosa]|uniref:VDE lipocalin domain-containing protein n=1 Tax=Populus tomentosa TaxID=118781 RepID=A0A8X8BZW0_POPTO|nr:hypothetical protein POTOM_061969 [Populus tomentosa]